MAWRPDYVTAEVLKAELRITDAVDDDQVARWATSASRAVDKFCHRQFGQVDDAELREYPGEYDRGRGPFATPAWVYDIDDLQDVTGLQVLNEAGGTVTAAHYRLLPRNSPQLGQPYTQIRVSASPTSGFPFGFQTGPGELQITALWGWTAIPANVEAATLLQGIRFSVRRDSPYGIAGSPSDGSEVRLLARVDPDVEVMLGPFRRETWAY